MIILKGKVASKGNAKGKAYRAGSEVGINETNDLHPLILVVDSLEREIYKYITGNIHAVIANRGSIACHGAGILRELGIPCIVECSPPFPAELLGEIVEINAQEGLITIHANKKEALSDAVGLVNMNSETNELDGNVSAITSATSNHPIRISEHAQCYRAERRYQKLRFDMLKEGWEDSPKFLFGLPRCQLELSERAIIVIHGGPLLEDIRTYVLSHTEWFFTTARERQDKIVSIKKALLFYNKSVNSVKAKDILSSVEGLVNLYNDLLRYVYFTQFIADDLVNEWMNLIETTKSEITIMQDLLKSDYNRYAIIDKNYPGKSTYWTLPSKEPYVWKGEVFFNMTAAGEEHLLKSVLLYSLNNKSNTIIEYSKYRLIVPIVYQMAEEHYFVSSSLCSYINRAIDSASKLLYGKGVDIESRRHIYSLSLNEFKDLLIRIS